MAEVKDDESELQSIVLDVDEPGELIYFGRSGEGGGLKGNLCLQLAGGEGAVMSNIIVSS